MCAQDEPAWVVAKYLTEAGFPKSLRARIKEWTEVNVFRFVRDPIYCGEETYRVLKNVKKYGKMVGLKVSDAKGRGSLCTHSIRKSGAVSALKHGAPLQDVKEWLGHAHIATTQTYTVTTKTQAEDAARRSQIR